jgi:unsaturated rhamnogalacturonyl hydrolase
MSFRGAAVAGILFALATPLHGGEGETPAGGGRRLSTRVVDTIVKRHPVVHPRWDYTAGLILYAMEQAGQAEGDRRTLDYVKDNIDRLVAADGTIRTYELEELNLDQVLEGRVLFPLYERTHDERYRKAAAHLREQLRRQPRTSEGGFWHKQIYPEQMWLDGLYMAEPFYARWAGTFGEPADFDDVARQLLLAARHTRDTRTGLYTHGWDESRSQIWADRVTGQSPSFWGRGMGWYAMALVDVLDELPANHRDRAALLQVLASLAEAVVRVQDPVTGLWYQVLDQPNRDGNYLEASASAMFAYALGKGARRGYLPATFRTVAERALSGLATHLVEEDADGLVSLGGICQVAGLGGKQQRDGSFEYYMREPVVKDDYKGIGPLLLAALELGR